MNAAQLYAALTLNHHAITLALVAPYDTITLTATPRSGLGTILTDQADSETTTWTLDDSSKVRINAAGVVTALAPATGVRAIARRTIGLVTQSDTALININDIRTATDVPRVATLSLQPDPTDTRDAFLLEVYAEIHFIPRAVDAQGDTIDNVAFRIISTNPSVIFYRTGECFAEGRAGPFILANQGHTNLVTDATVYGVQKLDTLVYALGWWPYNFVNVMPKTPSGSRTTLGYFDPQDVTIATGGTVTWVNQLPGLLADIVFDDPSAAQAVDSATFLEGSASDFQLVVSQQGGGNIPAFAPLDTGVLLGTNGLGVRARRFNNVGDYRYKSMLYGTSGVVHVLPELQVP